MDKSARVFRCYSTRSPEGYWESFCVDLCLASRGDSAEEAAESMMAQVKDYVEEAYSDPEHTEQLLSRKAPALQFVKFYSFLALHRLKARLHRGEESGQVFKVPMQVAA